MIESLAPIAGRDARILVLGTMPGSASLEAQEYYAHPRNSFWRIMARLYDFDRDLPYADRCAHLKRNGVAVWDMLHRCRREGSLDSEIRDEEPNDLTGFLATHTRIERVLLNGGKAAGLFRKHAEPAAGVQAIQVPSTSPAHARVTFEQKLAAWRAASNHVPGAK